MQLFLVKVTSGQHAGVYVNQVSGFRLPSTSRQYFLHPEERMATRFFEFAVPAVQAEMKRLGFQIELVPSNLGKQEPEIADPDLADAIYRTLDRAANTARNENRCELEIQAAHMQQAVGAIATGRVREVCGLLENEHLLNLAGLELIEREGIDSHLATRFRYKIHGPYPAAVP